MQNDERPQKTEYRSPEIVSLGDAANVTLGNGDVHSDYLGNPLTKYGQYGTAETDEGTEESDEESAEEEEADEESEK